MNLPQLQQRVDRYVKLDLSPLFDHYKAERGSEDIDGFVAHLVTARVLDPSLVKDLYSDTEVELPSMAAALALTSLARKPGGGTLVMGPKGPSGDTKVSPMTPDEVGTIVGGFTGDDAGGGAAPAAESAQDARFEPIARLGQGAMGAIDVARDVYLRRKVALKTVLPEMAQHKALLGRFLSEMQITAQLEHPNIVPVYALEVGADGTLGYAMKLVAGKDFAEMLEEARKHIEAGKPLPPHLVLEQRLEVFLKVCDALEYAHAKGILHRDLKPANVMVGKHNEVYLMDWGIARPMGAGGQAIDAGIEIIPPDGEIMGLRTRVGSTIGTPTYMSPEQAAGKNHELDGRSDQYTMGLILQETVTLKQAVGGKTLEEVLTKAREARRDPVEVTDKGGALPRDIEAIVKKATSLDVASRYPSIRELAEDVRRFLRNEPLRALPDDGLRRVTRWISKNRTTSLAIMLAIALLGSGATIVTQRIGAAKIEAIHDLELRKAEFETESAIAAQVLDRKLARYESALSALAGAAQLAFSHPAPAGPGAAFAEEFGKEGGPADVAPSKRYGTPVSIASPAIALLPKASRGDVEATARPYGSALAVALRDALLDSAGLPSRRLSQTAIRDYIAEVGTPVMRARIALSSGATISYPGAADAVASDPGADPIFQTANGRSGIFWGTPVARGATSVLPVSTAIYDGSEPRGLASLEVAMDRLLDSKAQPELDYVRTRLLVARDGTIRGEWNAESGRAPLAKEVLAAVAEGKSGTFEYDGEGKRWIATYYSLTALDWSFVSIADMGRMVSSTKEIVQSDTRAVASAAVAPPPGAAASAVEPAPPPAPSPPTSASAEPEPSASAPTSASAPPAPSLGPPWPKASASAPPAPPPSGPPAPEAPRNPFDKWQEYQKK